MDKDNNFESLQLVSNAGDYSIRYELANSSAKKIYIMNEIIFLNKVFKSLSQHKGTFGTGYPFYVLGENLKSSLLGNMPIINEQVRYGSELMQQAASYNGNCWPCYDCLNQNYDNMPNLKFRCVPCGMVPDELKPRKVINRLPDIDLWFVAKDNCLMSSQEDLLRKFSESGLSSSDMDPLKTIEDMGKIVKQLEKGNMPNHHLPLDVHIVEYNSLRYLIERIPDEINSNNYDLRIFPYSLRKNWDYDGEGYNFIHDFLFSFSIIDFDDDLKKLVYDTRHKLATNFSPEVLYNIFEATAAPSTLRRCKTRALRDTFNGRVESWKK